MLLFLPFLFLLTAFLFSVSKKSKSIRYLAILLFAFLADILAFMLYLGRDNYYYNVIQNYFGVSRRLWDYFALAPFSQDWIIRIINFSSMMFLYFCVVFSGSFSPKKISGKLLAALAMPLILQPVLTTRIFTSGRILCSTPTMFRPMRSTFFTGCCRRQHTRSMLFILSSVRQFSVTAI